MWTVFRDLRWAMSKKCTGGREFNARTRCIVAQCHTEGVLLPHQRLVAVVVPSQCGFRPRPMSGGCRRRRPVPNRLSLTISYYDTPVRFVCSPPPHESARCPAVTPPTRRVSVVPQRLFLLPPSAGLPGVPVVPRQICLFTKELGDRNHSVTESFCFNACASRRSA